MSNRGTMSILVKRLRDQAHKACERHNNIDQYTQGWQRKPQDFIEWEAAGALLELGAEIKRLRADYRAALDTHANISARVAELEALLHEYKDAEHRALKSQSEALAERDRLRELLTEHGVCVSCGDSNEWPDGDQGADGLCMPCYAERRAALGKRR